MPRIDGYLRSIERLGASGALMVSGQMVTLKFAAGDRQATQTTPHDQLVALVKEIAPVAVVTQLDQQRAARFEFANGGFAYVVSVNPKPNAWTVLVEPVRGGLDPGTVRGLTPNKASGVITAPRGSTPAVADPPPVVRPQVVALVETGAAMELERTPYELAERAHDAATTSGSSLLDELFTVARHHRASDLYLAGNAAPIMRVAGELVAVPDRQPLDAYMLERELGIVAPADAREAWHGGQRAAFIHSNGDVRLRIQLMRDRQGACATIRFMVAEPPAVERLGIPAAVVRLLEQKRGLIVVAGAPGAGKTTTMAALVHYINTHYCRYIVDLQAPIEILQASRRSLFSQREVGEHVATFADGIYAAVREGAEVIAVGACNDAEVMRAIRHALDAGAMVLVNLDTALAQAALQQLIAQGGDGAGTALAQHLACVVAPIMCRRGDGSGRMAVFEVVLGTDAVRSALRREDWAAFEVAAAGGEAGMMTHAAAVAEAVRRGASV